jgi:hypothetical protein
VTRRLKLPSPALAISVLALFVALGGTGYAAMRLPRDSVGTIQLQNNSIIAPKIRNGTIVGKKIKNGAVTAGKINPKGLTVPNATHASIAVSAQSAAIATTATSAGTATIAASPGALASGRAETGVYDVEFTGASGGAAISFPFPLAPPATHVEWLAPGAAPDTGCPGSAATPEASRGFLCLYASAQTNVAASCVADAAASCAGPSFTYGAVAEVTPTDPTLPTRSVGTWAVTAP